MADEGGKPLADLTARLIDRGFATHVAGWWLAALGATVTDRGPDGSDLTGGPSSAGGIDDAPAVVRRFLAQHVMPAGSSDAPGPDIVFGHGPADAPGATIVRARAAGPTGESQPLETIGSEQVLWAESGLGDLTRERLGHADSGGPCVPANRQPGLLAGATMALLAVAARVARLTGGGPPRLAEIDRRGLLALLPMQPLARAQLAPRPTGVGSSNRPTAAGVPGGVFESSDGPLYVRPVEPDHWRELLGRIPSLPPPGDGSFLGWDPAVIDEHLTAWMAGQRRDDLVGPLQDLHVPMAPVRTVAEVFDDPHLRSRDFATPGAEPRVRPPWVVLADGRGDAPAAVGHAPAAGPLAGIRVLDLTWAWAGPFATRLLADLGAEVLNIEWHPRASNLRTQSPYAPAHPGSPNAGGWWSANQRGKRSIGVNLKHPEGRNLILELARDSHLAMENFAPGVVERLGVGYDDLVPSNRAMVYVSMSGWGRRGPSEHWIGYGTQIQAAAGADLAMPGPSGGPSHMLIPYADPVSGLAAAVGAVAYLYAALASGHSAHLDVSELECMALTLLEPLLEAGAGLEPTRYPYAMSSDGASSRLHPFGSTPGDPGFPVQTMSEVLADRRLAGAWMEDRTPEIAGSGAQVARAPWTWDGQPAGTPSGAPTLFADTRAVLRDALGIDDAEVDRLVAIGAIATAAPTS